MFRSYSNTSKYFLSDYVTTAMVIFLLVEITCYISRVKNMLFSRVKISCLSAKTRLVFHFIIHSTKYLVSDWPMANA